MNTTKCFTGLLTGIAMLAAVAACGANDADSSDSAAGSAKLGHIRLVLGGPPSTSLALVPFGVAQQMGFWSKQGLDVEVTGLAGQATAAQQLVSGQTQVATVGPETYLKAVTSGEPIGIKAFYTWVRKATWTIVVPADSPVQTLADLKGKTVGVAQIGKSDGKVAQQLIGQAAGIAPAEVKLLPIGNGASALQALKKGQVAAYSDGDASAAQVGALGLELRTLALPPQFASASDVTFSATPDFIAKHSDQLVALGRGWAEAVTFCRANEDACVKAFWKQYPKAKPQNADADFAAAAAPFKATLDARLPKYFADNGKWGETQLAGWQQLAAVYDYKNLDAAKLESYFTNDLVPQMSDFDAAKVEQSANAYQG
jgi:NitT/TauT family transport system substrate-binding protein